MGGGTTGGGGAHSQGSGTQADPWVWDDLNTGETASVWLAVTPEGPGGPGYPAEEAEFLRWTYTVTNDSLSYQMASLTPGMNGFQLQHADTSGVTEMESSIGWLPAIDGSTIEWKTAAPEVGPYMPIGATNWFSFRTPAQPRGPGFGEARMAGNPEWDPELNRFVVNYIPALRPMGLAAVPAAPPTVSIDVPKLIPVNANNDNSKGKPDAERWKPNTSKTTPVKRDFDAATIPEADPQLLPVTLTVTGKLGGTLTVTSQGGPGRVRFYESGKKGNVFTSVEVPAGADFTKVIYVEGVKESEAVEEITIKATFVTAGIPPVSDEKKVAVAPIIMDYKAEVRTAIPTPYRDWARGGQVAGMAAGRQAQNGDRGSEREGMRFTADLISGGFAQGKFVQIVTGVTNGAPSSFELINGQQRQRYNFQLRSPNTFPVNDAVTDAQVPYYHIVDHPAPPAPAEGREVFVTVDSPGFKLVIAGGVLARMDMTFDAKTHVVWTYSDGSLYALAWVKWNIVFAGDLLGNTFQVRNSSTVTADGQYTRDNSDPSKLSGRAFNALITYVPR